MATAATLTDLLPRALSFTGTKRVLNAFADQLQRGASNLQSATVTTVLTSIAKLKLPHRPGRIEPRAKKRRPKNLPLLTVPRHLAREAIRVQRGLILVP